MWTEVDGRCRCHRSTPIASAWVGPGLGDFGIQPKMNSYPVKRSERSRSLTFTHLGLEFERSAPAL